MVMFGNGGVGDVGDGDVLMVMWVMVMGMLAIFGDSEVSMMMFGDVDAGDGDVGRW